MPARLLAQIFCNGVEVMSCGGTKPEYIVDVWSGNHPFYQGNKTSVVIEDGRVNRFNKARAPRAACFSSAVLRADARRVAADVRGSGGDAG